MLGEEFATLLALLGADIHAEVAGHLEAIAQDTPARLAPSVDAPLRGRALARHAPDLLVGLTTTCYVDDEELWSRHDDGVRDHDRR